MNRELKFRAWHKEKNVMVYDNEDDSCGYWDGCCNSNVGMINTILNAEWYKVYEFMQYTGLDDKNGKEIYEEDILKVHYRGMSGVGYVEYDNDYCEYRIIINADKDYFNLWENIDLEKIGNIYDNPELLGGEQI